MSNCRSCNAEIEWVETKNGKTMPLDVAETPCKRCDGSGVVIFQIAGVARFPSCATCGGGGRMRLSHFATCDKPETFRKPRHRKPKP